MIEVKHLTKKYGSFTAVNDISFTVEKGRIYGFLGPNGAGKSTTMNMITGCLAATSGEITVNGYDVYENPVEAKAAIGYLPELPPLYTDMTPEEYLTFVAEAKGIDSAHIDVRVEEVMEKTSLTHVRDRLIKNLSKGYRQRVGIAQAILGDPEVIILDEPTVGLDPLQIIEIRDLIRDLGREHTVILSSHILSEISAVCDYIIIISHGNVVASDTIENLTASADGRRLITLDIRAAADAVQKALKELSGAVSTTVTYGMGGCVRVSVETAPGQDLREELFRLFARHDLPILEMSSNDVSLEDVFLRLTGDDGFAPIPEDEAEDEADSENEVGDEAESDPSDEDEETPDDEADSPYYGEAPARRKSGKSDSDDDYRPLFGKKQ